MTRWPLIFLAASTAYGAEPTGAVAGKVTTDGAATTLVVYVEKVPKAAPKPKPAAVAQKDLQFAPGAVVVTAGTPVDFPNRDKVFHNVFSLAPGNEFDLGLYRAGESKTAQMNEPGEVDVFCNIHPDMAAKILVLQNDFYVPVKPDGTYELAGLPAGKYALVAWSPEHKPDRKPIEIKAGAKAAADFTLGKRAAAKAHLNKNGEQYGRYK